MERTKIRRKMEEPRNTTVNIRVSRSEKVQLQKLAGRLGVSVGAYLIGLALGEMTGKALVVDKPDPRQTKLEGV